MLIYKYFFLLSLVSVIVLLIHYFLQRKGDVPVNLFIKALKDENNGHFEEAIIAYETALREIKKIGIRNQLKNKIIGKLKILYTFVEYKNKFHFKRVV